MNILINNVPSLIGDFLGVIPTLQEYSKQGNVYIQIPPTLTSLLKLTSRCNPIYQYNGESVGKTVDINIHEAFTLSHKNNLYMTQAFMMQAGLPVPNIAPKAISYVKDIEVRTYDYVICPFARSLPENQKWSK